MDHFGGLFNGTYTIGAAPIDSPQGGQTVERNGSATRVSPPKARRALELVVADQRGVMAA
jgi:hypothetical protein